MNRLIRLILPRVAWLIALAILAVCIAMIPAFQKPTYWVVLARQAFPAAALALVLTPIILTGGIDLSIASVAVFSSVVIGFLWQGLGWPVEWAVLGGIAAGGLAGLCNAMLILVGVLPLVATLATRELFRGLAVAICGRNPVTGFPPELKAFWRSTVLGLPIPVLGLLILALLVYLWVHHTWIGRMIFAMGDNERAARFAGAPIAKLKLGMYLISGLVAGLCGVVLIMRYDTAAAESAESSLDLIAIACVVLGGTRVTGGQGHVIGTCLGVVTLIALQAGLQSVTSTWRVTILGAVLVLVAICNEAAARTSLRLEQQAAG